MKRRINGVSFGAVLFAFVSKIGRRAYMGSTFLQARILTISLKKSNRKAMNRNWNNQKANPALKTKTENK